MRRADAAPARTRVGGRWRRSATALAVVALVEGATGAPTFPAARTADADDGAAAPDRAPIDPWLERLHRGPGTNESASLLPWVEQMVAAGRAHAGTETGALLLSGAASELARRGVAPERARALLEEALSLFSPYDPRSGLLWLDLADVRNDLGDPTGVLEALERADAVAGAPDPRDEAYPGPQLRARLREDVAQRGEGLRRHALAAVGRHAEAAALWERRARTSPAGRDVAWEWAAEEAWSAGDRERALHDIDAAIASSRDDTATVARVGWRLRAAFGQLTERGDAALRPVENVEEVFTAFRAAVRDHGDRRGGFQLALDGASFAMGVDRPDELLEFLSLAFTSPGFSAEAARSLSRRLEIVTGARLALLAGQPAQALAWLRLAEHHHGGPLPRTEGFRQAIEEALRPSADPRVSVLSPALEGLSTPADAPSRERSPRPGLGVLPTPTSEAAPGSGSPSPAPPPIPDADGLLELDSPALALGFAALTALALLLFGPRWPQALTRRRASAPPREAR